MYDRSHVGTALISVCSDIHMVCLWAVSNSMLSTLRFCNRNGCFTFLCRCMPLGLTCPPVEDLTVCVMDAIAFANARVASEGLFAVASLGRYLRVVRVCCVLCCVLDGAGLNLSDARLRLHVRGLITVFDVG